MGKVIGCGFCPEIADITGEHLWPGWFGKKLGRRKYVISQLLDDGTMRRTPKYALNEKAPVVCRKCNNGWMSVLESKTKKITNEMALYGSPRILAPNDLAIIAANTLKGAIVADLMHDNRLPFFTLLQRRKFAATLASPTGVQMWIACMARHQGVFKSYYFATKPGASGGFEFDVFTYGLGHLLLQCVSTRWKKKAHRRHAPQLRLTQDSAWDDLSIPFWPIIGSISWPPAQALGDQILDQFVNRWAHLVKGNFPTFRSL